MKTIPEPGDIFLYTVKNIDYYCICGLHTIYYTNDLKNIHISDSEFNKRLDPEKLVFFKNIDIKYFNSLGIRKQLLDFLGETRNEKIKKILL